MRKFISIAITAVLFSALSVGCEYDDSSIRQDTERTISAANNLQSNQPTPTDINYSLERLEYEQSEQAKRDREYNDWLFEHSPDGRPW